MALVMAKLCKGFHIVKQWSTNLDNHVGAPHFGAEGHPLVCLTQTAGVQVQLVPPLADVFQPLLILWVHLSWQ